MSDGEQLLLMSLGPIQDFIASARRCQDLWYGSWLLSDLSRAAAVAIEGRQGSTLVFPGALGNDKPSVANKILAIVDGGAQGASEAAGLAEKAMRERLGVVMQEAFASLEGEDFFHREVAEAQVRDLMEFQWAAVPLADGGYPAARERVEAALAAVKRSRTWGPVSWTAGQVGVPKSSLDGQRESVIDERLYLALSEGVWTPSRARRVFGIRAGERLCGVGLLKRRGVGLSLSEGEGGTRRERLPAFHSTAHMAAAPLLRHMRSNEAVRAFETYCNVLRDRGVDLSRLAVRRDRLGDASFTSPFDRETFSAPRAFGDGIDGQVLYESRLESVLEEQLDDEEQRQAAQLGEIKAALREVLRALGGAPPAYYALMLADGDSMGAAIDALARSGGLKAHRVLSRALEGFSQGVEKTVARFGGSLIYAGGDDVLAMLPLHTALPCMRTLHDDFSASLRGATGTLGEGVARPTLSMGAAIVHYLEPFGEAREWARRAERKAKNHTGKDALAVIAVPRSGAETSFVSSWSDRPDERLERWVTLFAAGEVSQKAPHDLLEALEPLRVGLEDGERSSLAGVVKSLARRVLSMKRRRGGGAMGADARSLLEAAFAEAAEPFAAVEALVSELLVAQSLLPGYRAAFGTPARQGQEDAA